MVARKHFVPEQHNLLQDIRVGIVSIARHSTKFLSQFQDDLRFENLQSTSRQLGATRDT